MLELARVEAESARILRELVRVVEQKVVIQALIGDITIESARLLIKPTRALKRLECGFYSGLGLGLILET